MPAPGDLPIFLDRKPADAIERHALRDTSVELGGILLGRECLDDLTGEPFVWITEALEAKHYENTQASFTYTHNSWGEITRERDELYPDLDIVGWYHTHPDFGVFLSGHDLFIHRNFFDQPLQVAYVVDPIRQTRGFFRWKDDGLDEVGGFTLTADRADRVLLARLANDLESLPNAEGGGSGLSPRIEAELIAMLTRPAYQTHAPADRAQTAAFASVAGLLIGVLGFAAVLWVNALNSQVHDQAEKIKQLGSTVQGNTDMQRMALDALIHKAEAGSTTVDPFTGAYKKALNDRDTYRTKSENLAFVTEGLAAENRALQGSRAELVAKLDKAESEAKEAAMARSLRDDLGKATLKIADLEATVDRKDELLKAVDQDKAAGLIFRARWGVYLAVAGWIVATLLGIGLVTLWTKGPSPEEPDPGRTNTPPESPTHVIS